MAAIKQATAILVGGGNTWVLTATMQRLGLMEPIRDAVSRGIPYSGWSAGSNVACPTLMTTNDMPIAEPESFHTLGLIPFQINPHYLDKAPEGHGGETRDFRIVEFITQNPNIFVAGLREGSRFLIQGDEIEVHGENHVRIVLAGGIVEAHLRSQAGSLTHFASSREGSWRRKEKSPVGIIS